MLTVADLIAELENLDPTLPVHFAYNYGDHWQTEVAPAITTVDITYTKYSDYHSMPRTVEDPNEERDPKACTKCVVLS